MNEKALYARKKRKMLSSQCVHRFSKVPCATVSLLIAFSAIAYCPLS